MMLFFQIVLAVILVLVLTIVIGWWWIKRKLTQSLGGYSVASDLVDFTQQQPARIQLRRADFGDCGPSLEELAEQCRSLGFQRMADFEEAEDAFYMLQALRHRDLPIAAGLIEGHEENVSFVMFAVSKDKQVTARGNSPGRSTTTTSLDWQLNDELSPQQALEVLRRQSAETDLPIDLRVFRAVYEQAHAARMDQQIIHPPKRETIEQRAAKRQPPATAQQIDCAYEMLVSHWHSQIEQAALDRYRRSSKIDAVAWEEQRDDIQVVHPHLDAEEIRDLLVSDNASEEIFKQCQAQDLSGIELYQAIAERLPPDQQWKKVGEVARPVRAALYAPNEDIQSDTPVTRRYIYDAQDTEGELRQGGVFAESSRDAKQQIANLGLHNAKLLIEPMPGNDDLDDMLMDEQSAILAAKSASESIGRSIGRSLLSNWWIWALPTALLAKTIADGYPLSVGDYVVIAYAAIALLALLFLVGPVVLYHQLLLARVQARWGRAKFLLGVLGKLNLIGAMTESQLISERCNVLSGAGQLDQALSLWDEGRPKRSKEEHQTALVSIYDAAGEWPAMIKAQRALIAETRAKETPTVDLAMSLARYGDDIADAESLIQTVQPTDLSELGLAGYQFVRGLVAAKKGQHPQALRHYSQAVDSAKQFVSNPLILGFIAEINGYAALSFKRAGQAERAQSLWQQVLPVLKLHRSGQALITSFEAESASG